MAYYKTISIAKIFAAELEYGALEELDAKQQLIYNDFHAREIDTCTSWLFVDNYNPAAKRYPIKKCALTSQLTECLDVELYS